MKLSIVATLIILLAAPAMARTVTVTGQNGGTAVSTGTCQAVTGGVQCSSHLVATGPRGGSVVRDATSMRTLGGFTRTTTGVTGSGRTFGHTTVITR